MWSVHSLICTRCGKVLGIIPDKEGYAEALIKDLVNCPRCRKKLSPPKTEYHHEIILILKEFFWKLTHPWKLFK